MQSIGTYIQHPNQLGIALLKHLGKWMPDKLYLQLRYRLEVGQRLNLSDPKSFSEKLQWLKLYNRQPEYTIMVDKVKVKEYVASIVGEEHIVPTIGVWDRPEDIVWDCLPHRFVLKTNHSGGSTGVIVCKDKDSFDRQKAIDKLTRSFHKDVFYSYREWPYKNVERKVFAEEYIAPPLGVKDLPDYKWYCFGGEPLFCQVIQDRTTHETIDFFDTNWQHQEYVGLNPKAHNATVPPARPSNLDQHLYIARKLSKNIPFARIDLYETEKGVLFGEITFYPMSGMGLFRPIQWNYKLGELIHIQKTSTTY